MSGTSYRNGLTEESCLAYVVTPEIRDAAAFLAPLEHVLRTLPVAAIRLRLAEAPRQEMIRTVETVKALVFDYEAALMLENHPELARLTGCDGAHVAAHDVADARAILGKELQLGASCGFSRDDAMRAGESGADYIAFGPFDHQSEDEGLQLLRWWREMMELPVVAECFPQETLVPASSPLSGFTDLSPLSGFADFLALGVTRDGDRLPSFWQNPEPFAALFQNPV